MFKRIFGGTEEEQIKFLQVRSIITLISLPIAAVISWGLIALVMLFIWGWSVVKNWFGITAIGAIFSRNIMIGVLLFVF